MTHHPENLNADFSSHTVTWPLSLGMSSGAGTLNFGVPCHSAPPWAPGLLAGERSSPLVPASLVCAEVGVGLHVWRKDS